MGIKRDGDLGRDIGGGAPARGLVGRERIDGQMEAVAAEILSGRRAEQMFGIGAAAVIRSGDVPRAALLRRSELIRVRLRLIGIGIEGCAGLVLREAIGLITGYRRGRSRVSRTGRRIAIARIDR